MSGKSDSSSADAEVKKITITVLSISITFVVLTVPLSIWYAWVEPFGIFFKPLVLINHLKENNYNI